MSGVVNFDSVQHGHDNDNKTFFLRLC